MERRKDLPYLTVAWLAAVAIAGLLSMHGLDPAVFQPDQVTSHGVHTDTPEDGIHAIGLCVFAIATYVGLAIASSRGQPHGPRVSPMLSSAIGGRPHVLSASGRRRLANLCVFRL